MNNQPFDPRDPVQVVYGKSSPSIADLQRALVDAEIAYLEAKIALLRASPVAVTLSEVGG